MKGLRTINKKNGQLFLKNIWGNNEYMRLLFPFIWHGFFLGFTMSMIEINTVLPNLISELTRSNVAFGGIYSIMLGAPLLFNLLFSHYLSMFQYKKKFLLFGIYLRSASFLGMSIIAFLFAKSNPLLALFLFYIMILLFSLSGGFAGIAYSDIVGKLFTRENRPSLYAARQIFSSIASIIGGFIVVRLFVPENLNFPLNYSMSMAIGFVGLIIGAFGFWKIDETPSIVNSIVEKKEKILENTFIILKKDKAFLKFIIIENMTSFSLMILPFYMVFVKNTFIDYKNYFGLYVIAQITGGILSNFLWAKISRTFDSTTVLKICILTGAIIPLIAIILRETGAAWYFIVFMLMGMITSGRNMGFEPYLLDLAPGDKRTIYLGIRGSLNVFVVLLPIIGGLFIDKLGFVATFVIVSIIMFMAFYLMKNEKLSKV